ncbi:hypothetical protein AAFF_G00413190 [Aldrovandia affinis]|uniref:Uncharacterized protein n=1 Tax=Aldrovandia affinis TaxID=143900 RepID=A0AAD7WJF9_9TELE|nr:hypothetical protein AAFF_G00413190 [Aldrovandia affinis]
MSTSVDASHGSVGYQGAPQLGTAGRFSSTVTGSSRRNDGTRHATQLLCTSTEALPPHQRNRGLAVAHRRRRHVSTLPEQAHILRDLTARFLTRRDIPFYGKP